MENVRRQFNTAGEGKAVAVDELDGELKTEINNFVWMYAPEHLTLGQADDMAMKIYELFAESRKLNT